MNEESKLTAGMYFNLPSDKAPDFIKGSISIEPKQFTEWMRQNYNKDEKYIRIDLKVSKAGKAYSILSDFKPNQTQGKGDGRDFEAPRHHSERNTGYQKPPQDDFQSDIPF